MYILLFMHLLLNYRLIIFKFSKLYTAHSQMTFAINITITIHYFIVIITMVLPLPLYCRYGKKITFLNFNIICKLIVQDTFRSHVNMKFKLLCTQEIATLAAVGTNNIVTKQQRWWRSRGVETSGPENQRSSPPIFNPVYDALYPSSGPTHCTVLKFRATTHFTRHPRHMFLFAHAVC